MTNHWTICRQCKNIKNHENCIKYDDNINDEIKIMIECEYSKYCIFEMEIRNRNIMMYLREDCKKYKEHKLIDEINIPIHARICNRLCKLGMLNYNTKTNKIKNIACRMIDKTFENPMQVDNKIAEELKKKCKFYLEHVMSEL